MWQHPAIGRGARFVVPYATGHNHIIVTFCVYRVQKVLLELIPASRNLSTLNHPEMKIIIEMEMLSCKVQYVTV